MQKENQTYKVAPADRLAGVSEYYFSKKLKEVARMNAEGKDVISLGRPSKRYVIMPTIRTDTVINRMWVYRNFARVLPTGINAGMEWN